MSNIFGPWVEGLLKYEFQRVRAESVEKVKESLEIRVENQIFVRVQISHRHITSFFMRFLPMSGTFRAVALIGISAAVITTLILTFAYKSVPLVNGILQTGVPVIYYGQAMILLISGAVGLGVSLVVAYLMRGPRYHRSRRQEYSRRLFGYGSVGFLSVGVPALLMDPGAMSVGLGVIVLWKTMALQQEEAAVASTVEEKELLAREVRR